MKRFLSITATGLLTLGMVLAGSQARAQNEPSEGAPPRGDHMGRPRGMDAEHQLQRMSESLGLSNDQKQQVKPILEDRQKAMEQLHADNSVSMDQKRDKMHSLMEDSNNKIRALLNDDQKAKFDKMQERMRDRMRDHGDNPPPAPPQQ